MFEHLYFGIGLLNNLILISIFVVRKNKKIDIIKTVGKVYIALLGSIAVFAMIIGVYFQVDVRFIVFLSIFLAYLILEIVFDYILKIDFRKDWKLLTPYLILYYAMNYGFVVMIWKVSLLKGILLLSLFIIQMIVNIISHKKKM